VAYSVHGNDSLCHWYRQISAATLSPVKTSLRADQLALNSPPNNLGEFQPDTIALSKAVRAKRTLVLSGGVSISKKIHWH
jgi:hypothetical protein